LKDHYAVEYALPQRVTLLEGHIKLLGAIRKQAEVDGELEEWEKYWLFGQEMKGVWMLLRESGFSRNTRDLSVSSVVLYESQ
jgi:hypothetical protein